MRIVVLSSLLALGACDPTEPASPSSTSEVPGRIASPGERVMTVNGFEVGRTETDQVFRAMGVPEAQLDEVVASRMGYHVLEDYALATALYRMAVERKVYEDPEVQLGLAFAERQVLTRAMQAQLAREAVTDGDVKVWLEENQQRLSLPQVRVRQLAVPSEAYAQDLMDRLEAGEDFAQLAQIHSIDEQTKSRGGQTGWFTMADRPDIGQAVFAHTSQTVLGPIESDRVYFVVEVLERRDGTPMEERKVIARQILEQEAAATVRAQVRNTLDVEFVEPNPHMPPDHPLPSGEAPEGE